MVEHRPAHRVVALVGGKAQALVGFHGIGAGVLQLVGADLVEQADAAALLAQVEPSTAAALGGDGRQRRFQLGAAVAAQAEQRIAGQAFGVQTAEYRRAVGDIAQGQGHVLLAGFLVEEACMVNTPKGVGN